MRINSDHHNCRLLNTSISLFNASDESEFIEFIYITFLRTKWIFDSGKHANLQANFIAAFTQNTILFTVIIAIEFFFLFQEEIIWIIKTSNEVDLSVKQNIKKNVQDKATILFDRFRDGSFLFRRLTCIKIDQLNFRLMQPHLNEWNAMNDGKMQQKNKHIYENLA